jgi:hypothetical protein
LSTLVRSAALPRPLPKLGDIVAALAKAGVESGLVILKTLDIARLRTLALKLAKPFGAARK